MRDCRHMEHGPRSEDVRTGGGAGETTRLLTVSEVATLFRVSKMTVYRMVHANELASVRVGRSFRIPAAAVWAVLGQHRVDVASA
jgi:excisionase family DNA binding protein